MVEDWEHQNRIDSIHRKLDNIECNFNRMVLLLHLSNRGDCSPEFRQLIDDYIKRYLEGAGLTIKDLIDQELQEKK